MEHRPVLLFDVLGTLVHDPFEREIPEFFDLAQSDLVRHQHPTNWVEFERGEVEEEEYFRRYFADERVVDGEALRTCVRDAYRWIDGAEELLAELHREGFEIHALSNYPVWYRMIEARLCLSRYLSWTFVSCLTGVRKPEAEAYLGAARALSHRPSGCLFIDNCARNCQGAELVGMPALHFTGVDSLRSELEMRMLLRPREAE